MIRWSYLLPRITVLAIALFFVALGLDPLLRWTLTRAGQAALGAKVEILSLTTIPRQARIHVYGFQAANPKSPLKNLLEAREANLQLDPQALLRGRIVVQDGSVTGLRFNTDRTTSGALERERSEKPDSEAFQQALEEWLDQFVSLLDKEVVEQFESVEVARELVERWPKEYDRLEGELNQIRDRGKALRDSIEQARHKPLDNLPVIQRAVHQAAELRNEVLRLRRRADEIHQQFRTDCRSIELARKHDIERIESALQLTHLNHQAVTDYLLGPELAPYAIELMEWISWGKKWLDVAGDPPRPPRQRGVDFLFPREPAAPDWLVERLAISGHTCWGDGRARFEGVLTGLSADQTASGQPVRLVAQLEGIHPARLELLVDHRENTPVHRLILDCPALELGRRAIGKEEVLLLDVDEGVAQLRMELELRGRDIQGQVAWKQDKVRLAARLADRYRGPRANRLLKTALADATSLNAALHLNGSLDDPAWQVQASLGPELAEGINRAVSAELRDRRDALVMKLQLKVVAEVTQLEQRLADEQREVMDRLKISEELVQQLQMYAGTGSVIDPVRRTLQDTVQRKIQDRVDPKIQEQIRAAESQLPPGVPNWRDLIR